MSRVWAGVCRFRRVTALLGDALTAAFLLSLAVDNPLAVLLWTRRPRPDGTRCAQCGYRIDNLPGPCCPECGLAFVGPASHIVAGDEAESAA